MGNKSSRSSSARRRKGDETITMDHNPTFIGSSTMVVGGGGGNGNVDIGGVLNDNLVADEDDDDFLRGGCGDRLNGHGITLMAEGEDFADIDASSVNTDLVVNHEQVFKSRANSVLDMVTSSAATPISAISTTTPTKVMMLRQPGPGPPYQQQPPTSLPPPPPHPPHPFHHLNNNSNSNRRRLSQKRDSDGRFPGLMNRKCSDATTTTSDDGEGVNLAHVNISGLRAATDENRQKGRRYLWVFLLSVCFAVMIAQITDRVRHFISEPVSVSVTLARNQSLIYPSITICNKVKY